MTTNLNSNSRRRGATAAGMGGLALASVLLLCGAGNAPIANFSPQGAMQTDLNAGGRSVTNAASVIATNVAASSLNATSAAVGALTATNMTVTGALTATNFTLPFGGVTSTPTTLGGYGIGDAYTKTASDGRYAPLAGSTNITTLGAVTAGSIPYANVTGSPVTVAGGKTLGVSNTLTLAGTDGSTLNVGGGGTLGSAAFAATNAFLAPAAIGTTVQAYNANTTALGNTVNGTNSLVQTDGNGLLIDSVLREGAKTIRVSKSLGNDTRTGLSKYSFITPFATLTAAASAAAAGDIIIAEDGVFTDKNLTLVTGVNWIFMPGATITIAGAVTGDVIFKDAGTATTTTMEGCGQTFTITSTATSTSITGLSIGAISNVTLYGIGITANASASGSSATALACSGSSTNATVAITGNLLALGGTSGTGYGIYFGGVNGGTVVVNGNVTGSAPIYGYGFYTTGTTAGIVTVTQRLLGSYGAVNNSTVATVTCGELTDSNAISTANNRLTINSPVALVQPMPGTTTGFNDPFWYGPQDQVMQLTASGTLASGTVTFPGDSTTRINQRLTIMCTQTVTALTVSVASGTIYGWSGGSFGPGSITFQKIAANIWAKL